ncbi:MAG: HNH endonuclease [Thermomicrobiales bacterium]
MVAYVPLSQGYTAVIDDEDAERVLAHKWHADVEDGGKRIYAVRNETIAKGKRRIVRLHRFLMGEPDGVEVDHRDGNTLNNRRSNLRLATRKENARNVRKRATNRSGYKGVSWHARDRLWHARIMIDGRLISVGYFKNLDDAAAAYAAAAQRLHGEYARPE